VPERWLVELTGPARRGLDRLPEKVAAAVLEFMSGALSERPTLVGKPLRLDRAGEFTARRGTWRSIYELDHEHHVIRVLAVGHRSNVYRPK
jgi:mRNA-degrading endonuclease RelE of RelBE toxin-antitoxin system